jgi:hypothetical protein
MANKNFDFHEHAYDVMRQKWGSDRIPYHELYSYLGRRFCLRKQEVRRLLKGMERIPENGEEGCGSHRGHLRKAWR